MGAKHQIRAVQALLAVSLACTTACQDAPPAFRLPAARTIGLLSAPVTLKPSMSTKGDLFGSSVAIQGGTAIVGALNIDRAYLFTGSGSTWKQQDYIIPMTGTFGGYFSWDVAIGGDTALVWDLAKAYLFQRSGTVWSQKVAIHAPRAASYGYYCDNPVAVDQDTVIAGAPGDDTQGTEHGAAFIYVRGVTGWTRQDAIFPNIGGDKLIHFGASVGLHGDTAVVTGSMQPNIWIFTRKGTKWTQQTVLHRDWDGGTYAWGCTVDIHDRTIAVGDIDYGAGSEGAVFVYARRGSRWSLQQKVTASAAKAGDSLGLSLSLDGDIMAACVDRTGDSKLAGFVFARHGTRWTGGQPLVTPTKGERRFLSVDGQHIAVGNSGNAYIYTFTRPDMGPLPGPDAGPPDSAAPDLSPDAGAAEGTTGGGCSVCTEASTYAFVRMGAFLLVLLIMRRSTQ